MFRALLAIALLAAVPVQAQEWPTRPVRMIVPFPPGGGTDTVARPLAAKLAQILGQQVVIDNRGGAGGTIGAGLAAKAPPDGYTVLLYSVHGAVAAAAYKTLPYDLQKDLVPVTTAAIFPDVLVAANRVPAKTLPELIAWAKANPGKLNCGSAGNGTSRHLSCELFNAAAGVNATHIPYRGGNPAMQDLIAGRIDYSCNIITSAYPQVRDQQIKAQTLLGAKRAPLLPDLATAQEQGMAGFDAGSWNVVFVPKGTPDPVVRKLNAAMSDAMDSPETAKRLLSIGIDIAVKDHRSPAYAGQFVAQEIKKYEAPIKASGISIE